MEQGMEFLYDLSIFEVLTYVVAIIVADAVLGILKTFKPDNENFDLRKLPQFLSENVFPYIGGLIVLGVVAEFANGPITVLFYTASVTVAAKFVIEIKDKVTNLFGK